MVAHGEYLELDEGTLRLVVDRAGLVVDDQGLTDMLPLANELLEMSKNLSAFVGPMTELSPIYVVDKTLANGVTE